MAIRFIQRMAKQSSSNLSQSNPVISQRSISGKASTRASNKESLSKFERPSGMDKCSSRSARNQVLRGDITQNEYDDNYLGIPDPAVDPFAADRIVVATSSAVSGCRDSQEAGEARSRRSRRRPKSSGSQSATTRLR